MNVLGVGIDLVDIARIERMLARKGDRVLTRLLTARERAYVESMHAPTRHIAARVAAKEAAYKALQVLPGARPVGWHDLEVTRRADGRPSLLLHGLAAQLVRQHGPLQVELSLSHSDSTAAAVALLLKSLE